LAQNFLYVDRQHLQHYQHGIALFNQGEFWHAHEQWEICWLSATEPDRSFLQGLIQTAAALVHWQRANPRGLERNWYKARPKLVATAPQLHGIDILALIQAMDAFVLSNQRLQSAPQLRYTPF
jgi:predicted metal-dependent hydrolase